MGTGPKIGIGVVVALLAGGMVYSTLNLSQFQVEVCMEFGGGRECRMAAGTTREEALRTATDNACSFLASGRTESMACSRTQPGSIRWIKE